MDHFFSSLPFNPDWFALNPESYSLGIELFVRLLGAVYIAAYIPFLFQIQGLFGKEGIRPIQDYLRLIKQRYGKKGFYYLPTLFWLNASDTALIALVWSGIILGFCVLLGMGTPLILILLYLIHLSLTSAGQEFLSFGWETYLMELTIGAFLTVSTTPYNVFGWLGLNVLLFRFYLQAGASKLQSGDPNWRNLTAISYHYLTQPLPNTTAWYFHKLPMWFHKVSVLSMFFIELFVPFLMFSPPLMRLFVFVMYVGLQWSIWLTGNLSYLNHLTVVSCLILVHNSFLEPLVGPSTTSPSSPLIWQGVISAFAFVYFTLQILNTLQTFLNSRFIYRILVTFFPFHICYPHGIFAVMTTKRYEIIIEGSPDGVEWKEYEFFYKPGALGWRPRRVSPYQPRIDWQVWFLPFGNYVHEWWFQSFLIKLLEGSKPVLKLLKNNPFSEKPPLFIRASVYDYEFTTKEEKAVSGDWWKRQYVGLYAQPIRLKKEL